MILDEGGKRDNKLTTLKKAGDLPSCPPCVLTHLQDGTSMHLTYTNSYKWKKVVQNSHCMIEFL